MGVTILKSTLPNGYTPICNLCGIVLCYDIHESEYNEDKAFWDAWICKECNKGVPFDRKFFRNKQ